MNSNIALLTVEITPQEHVVSEIDRTTPLTAEVRLDLKNNRNRIKALQDQMEREIRYLVRNEWALEEIMSQCQHEEVKLLKAATATQTLIPGVFKNLTDNIAECMFCGKDLRVCPVCTSKTFAEQELSRQQRQEYLQALNFTMPEEKVKSYPEYRDVSKKCQDCGFETFDYWVSWLSFSY